MRFLSKCYCPICELVKLQNCQDCCIATALVKFMEESVSRFSAIDWGRRFVPASIVRAERFFLSGLY